jgi:ABC-type transporter Mla subunit MlaD
VLLAALTIALSGYRLKKPTRTLQIDYEDVTGIKVHSEVRYAGAPAGRVIAMRHLTAKERESCPNKKDAVRVTVSLDDGIPPLPTDVMATLSSDTMLAPKFVAREQLGDRRPSCLWPRTDHRCGRSAVREREQVAK